MKNFIIKMLKGMLIGLSMIIPGVSGGTVAVLLNIYDEIIFNINNLKKEFKNSVLYLLPIVVGAVLSFVIAYFPLKYLLENFQFQTISLFAGLMIGSTPKLIVDAKKRGFSKINIISIIIPFMIVIGVCFIPNMKNVDLVDMNALNYLLLFLVGALASCALIVPGISGSMLLLILGYYQPLLNIISDLKVNFMHSALVIIVFCIGLVIGFFTIARIMKILFEKYTVGTYWAIVGFVLASIIGIFLAVNYNFSFDLFIIISSVLIIIIGIILGYFLNKILGDKKE